MTPYFRAWIQAFLFTQAVEIPIHSVALGRDGPRRRWSTRALIGFGASAITHPFVWFLFPRFTRDHSLMMIEAETFAVVVEAVYLYLFGVRDAANALLWSVVANAASVALGEASRAAFDWP